MAFLVLNSSRKRNLLNMIDDGNRGHTRLMKVINFELVKVGTVPQAERHIKNTSGTHLI